MYIYTYMPMHLYIHICKVMSATPCFLVNQKLFTKCSGKSEKARFQFHKYLKIQYTVNFIRIFYLFRKF